MRARWFSRRSVGLHLAVLLWVPGCAVAAWWQVHVALAGDSLGWLYSVEWPVFALFGTIAWWRLVHDDPATVGRLGLERARALAAAEPDAAGEPVRRRDAEDEDLAAYNDYLAELAASERRKTWTHR